MNRIKECRINSKLSQKFVAVTLGVAAPSVSHWESGKTQPTPDNLRRLASLFNVSVDYLLGEDKATPEALPEIKKPTAPEDAEGIIPIEESTALLIDLGYIRPGEQLTDDDLAFLSHISGLMDAWFDGKQT